MNATVAVALIGAVATVAAATVGIVFNYLAGKRLHEANRKLAEDRHSHEREPAAAEQEDERDVRHHELTYEDRKAAYRRVGTWALVTAQSAPVGASRSRLV
jgi:membrane protein YqaA with SNARE-associated domain